MPNYVAAVGVNLWFKLTGLPCHCQFRCAGCCFGSFSDRWIAFWLFSDDLILTLVCQMGCGTLGGSCVILVEVAAADWQSDCMHCLLLVLHGCQVAVGSGNSGCESWHIVAIEINAGRQGRPQEMWRRLNQHWGGHFLMVWASPADQRSSTCQ